MTGQTQIDSERSELRLPLWAVMDAEGFRERGIPGALRIFHDELQGRFLDLFTREDIAKEYLRKASLPTWRAVELATPVQVRSAALACEQRGAFTSVLTVPGRRTRVVDFSLSVNSLPSLTELADRLPTLFVAPFSTGLRPGGACIVDCPSGRNQIRNLETTRDR